MHFVQNVAAVAVLVVALFHGAQAGEPLPPEAQYLTMQEFRKVNPDIEEDWTDYMQDLAGEHVTCRTVPSRLGAYTLRGVVAPVSGSPVGALMDFVEGPGATRQDLDAYAREIFSKWARTEPYRKQIAIADHFGCSVQPGCGPSGGQAGRNGYTVIGCAFVPACAIEGCVDQPDPPPIVMPKAKAFKPEQYSVAETMFGSNWDRSHFLENLSGIETDCEMIGTTSWRFEQALEQARFRGYTVYGRFGFAPNLGRTEPPLEQILREIRDEELSNNPGRNNLDLRVGCSVIPNCFSDRAGRPGQMYVVVSCLFSRDAPIGRV